VSDRQTIRKTLHFHRTALTGRVVDVIAALQLAAEQAPVEHRDAVQLEVVLDEDYQGPEIAARLFYERPETDAEIADRERQARQRIASLEAIERETYERLKAKFG
jgi:hypothetical protein